MDWSGPLTQSSYLKFSDLTSVMCDTHDRGNHGQPDSLENQNVRICS